MILGTEWAISLLQGGIFLAGVGLVVASTVMRLFDGGRDSRFPSRGSKSPLRGWVEGLIVGLFLLPLLLSVGNVLVGVRIDGPAVGAILFVFILGGWWRATHSQI